MNDEQVLNQHLLNMKGKNLALQIITNGTTGQVFWRVLRQSLWRKIHL